MQKPTKPISIILLMILFTLLSTVSGAQDEPIPPRDTSVPSLAAFAQPFGARAPAKDFTVNTRVDSVDVNKDDAECKDPNNLCSLRAAIMQANNLQAGSTIYIPAGVYNLTLDTVGVVDPEKGDLDILNGMTLIGAGAGATIIDGMQKDRVMEIASANVTLRFMTLRNGQLLGAGATGGALRIVANSSVTANAVTIKDSNADYGGGIDLQQSTLFLRNSSVVNNKADINGGGLTVFNGENTSTLTVENSTISGNTSGLGGGGVEIGSSTTVSMKNITVTKNTSGTTSAAGGGGILSQVTVTLSNSLVVANTANGFVGQQDCSATFSTDGTNMFTQKSGCTGTAADKTGTPILLPLSINGPGQTPTHALAANDTLAIDLGAPTCDPNSHDQRGIGRIQGAACDIGAFEYTEQYVLNGDFETLASGSSVIPADWKLIKTTLRDKVRCNTTKKTFSVSGNCAWMFRAEVPYKNARIQQKPDFGTLEAGDTLLLSGFIRGAKATNNAIRLQAILNYTDGTRDKITMIAPSGSFPYQHFYDAMDVAPKTIKQLRVFVRYNSGTGKAFVDAVSLVREQANVAAANMAIPSASIENANMNLLPLPPVPFEQ